MRSSRAERTPERGVGVRHRRRAALEPAGRRRPVERVDPERERVDAPEPPGDGRLEPLDRDRDARRGTPIAGSRQQVLQAAGHHEVDPECVHVDRARAGPLVVVEETLARRARGRASVRAAMSRLVAVPEADVCRRHDQRAARPPLDSYALDGQADRPTPAPTVTSRPTTLAAPARPAPSSGTRTRPSTTCRARPA